MLQKMHRSQSCTFDQILQRSPSSSFFHRYQRFSSLPNYISEEVVEDSNPDMSPTSSSSSTSCCCCPSTEISDCYSSFKHGLSYSCASCTSTDVSDKSSATACRSGRDQDPTKCDFNRNKDLITWGMTLVIVLLLLLLPPILPVGELPPPPLELLLLPAGILFALVLEALLPPCPSKSKSATRNLHRRSPSGSTLNQFSLIR